MIRFSAIAAYCAALVLFGIATRLSLAGAAITLACFLVLSFAGIVFLTRLVPAIHSSICLLVFGSILGPVCQSGRAAC